LLFSIHPDWTPDQVLKQIRVSSVSFGPTRHPDYYGRPDAYRALTLNETLSDIPGVMVTGHTVTTSAGDYFSEAGQTAQISVDLTNVLAPTTANATVSLSVKGDGATVGNAHHTLGALVTNAKATINFELTLSEEYLYSEGYLPVVITITDGEYVDYDVIRVPVYLEEGWHTALDLLYPYNSISMPDRWSIWISGHYAPGGVPTQDIAVRSTDGGTTWMFAFGPGFPSPQGVYCITGIDGERALVGTGPANGNAEIYRTTDGGASWSGVSVASMTPFVNWIHMFDASNGVFQGDPKDGRWAIGVTTNGGQTWAPIATPLNAPTGEAGWNNAYDFVGDTGWFGTNNSVVYKTTDRGATWTSYWTPSRHSVDVSFRDEKVGVLRFSRQNDTGSDTLAVTMDGGATWSILGSMGGGYGTVMFERGGRRLWYLRENAAFVSTDIGATWTARPAPRNMDFVSDADMWTDGFLTVAFAAGIEIFRFEAPFDAALSVGNRPAPIGLAIDQIYPNPVQAAQGATIQFSTPRAEPVTLALYDMQGRLLRTVLSATLDIGTHGARIQTSELAAGSYMLRLSTGSATVSSQLTVIR
jgi:hypothetical protein